MKHKEALQKRRRVAATLPSAEEVLRGSLLERTIFHRQGCARCEAGEGHKVWVLTITYPGGRNRQFSIRREQREMVERWLDNYQEWKRKMEEICELNHVLLRTLLQLLEIWRPAFSQTRSHRRAVAQALGILAGFGRRTLSRAICALGHQQQDWSADYRLHARAEWEPSRLFQTVLENGLPWCGGRYVIAAVDDTRLHKTGRHIQSAFYQRDPLSPKFRFNLMFGLRFLQISLLLPLYRPQKASPRALPVRFE